MDPFHQGYIDPTQLQFVAFYRKSFPIAVSVDDYGNFVSITPLPSFDLEQIDSNVYELYDHDQQKTIRVFTEDQIPSLFDDLYREGYFLIDDDFLDSLEDVDMEVFKRLVNDGVIDVQDYNRVITEQRGVKRRYDDTELTSRKRQVRG